MSKSRKILSSLGLFSMSFLSVFVYYAILIFLADYHTTLILIFSIVMIFAGIALLMTDFKAKVSHDSWKSSLGLILAVNPILYYILYLFLDPSTYTAF